MLSDKREREALPSFEELYTRHAVSVRILLHRYGAKGDIDDLVQESFIKIWKGMDSFKGDSSLTTWIFRIAVNVAKNQQRARKRKWWLLLSPDSTAIEMESPGQDVEQKLSDQGELDRMLESLSPKLRETLILFSIKELDIEEIGQILEISSGTVKSRLHLARQKLAEHFGDIKEIV